MQRNMASGVVDIESVRQRSAVYRPYTHPWSQIILISFICFCCPGMYNALSGLGGSGQVDSTVAANANVALLSATAATALFVVGPIFDYVGPRVCLLLGGWTYPLYAGSLLCFNKTGNGAFVIASGAILAIAAFWIIFNLGGGVGSLASFGLNYHSTSGTVSNATYIALLTIMALGWLMGVLICPPAAVRLEELHPTAEAESENRNWTKTVSLALHTIVDWRVLCILPLFFCANMFYSYQQNIVNGMTFNIRTRSLNSALYWIAQMLGGLIMGLILDIPWLTRPGRARAGWVFLVATGMAIWGGGYAFQKWSTARISSIATGPIFLYIFYGAFDAFWQSCCYWLMGTRSNSPAVAAILVGAYKTFQSTGGAMAWRVNALGKPVMTQFAMDWGLCMGGLVIALPSVLAVTKTNTIVAVDSGTIEKEERAVEFPTKE
ncbi:hypothetical protein BJX64DRAFT_296997 [Aspergillus heterothallicus]